MTSEEAQKLLQERGYFSRWEGRQLIGASHYRPGNPGAFEGAHFLITLVEPGLYEATVTDFDGQSKTFGGKPDDPSVVATLDPKLDLAGIVDTTLGELDRIMGHGREPQVVNPWSAIQLGQAAPKATSEVDALHHLFISEEREESMLFAIAAAGPHETPRYPSLTEQERAEAYPYTKERATPAKPWGPPTRNGVSKRPASMTSKHVVPYGYGPTMPLILRKHQDRAYHWAALDLMGGWPSQLRPIPPFLSLATPRTLSVTLLVSAIRQVLDVLPEWLELIVFTTEPVDDSVQACLLATKTEPPAGLKPQWLIAASIVEFASEGRR